MPAVLLDITIIFALAVVAALVCHRLKLPSSVGLLLAGVVAGPHALGLVRNADEIEIVAEVGIVLLLFVTGLEFSIGDLKNMRRQFLLGGSLQFFGTAAFVGLALSLAGLALPQAIFLGFVAALSSTAVVLKLLQDRAELDTPHGRTVLAALIYQDVAVVPILLLAPFLAEGLGPRALSSIGMLLARLAVVAGFTYVAYRWLVPWLLERITATRSREAFLVGVIAICLGVALFTQWLGLSLALGAFLAGILISESEYSHQAVTVILPFRDMFMSLFFVSIGLLVDLGYLMGHPWQIAALAVAVLAIKPLVAAIASLAVGLPLRGSVLAGFALGQMGEFSLVATQSAVAVGLLAAGTFQGVLDAVVITMLLTPALFAMAPRFAGLLSRTPLHRLEHRRYRPTQIDGALAYSGHVVIIGYGVTGQNLARTARLSEIPYAILEINAATVRNALRNGEPIHYGDASHETILRYVNADKARAIVVVIDDRAAARRIVESARRIAPDAYILVRSRYLREVGPLRELGADEVIADELEVSIEVFARVLSRMLVPREDVKRLIGEVRGDWRRMARTFAKEATAVSGPRVDVPDLATHTLRLTEASPLAGSTIADSRMREIHGVTVLAVTRGGRQLPNPRGETLLQPDDVLFVIGPPDWDPSTLA